MDEELTTNSLNVALQPLEYLIELNSHLFERISFMHVFRELNNEVNALPKLGLRSSARSLWPKETVHETSTKSRPSS